MRCPRCRELVPEGTAICDNCDEILDASLLRVEDDAPAQGEPTEIGPAPTQASPGPLRDPRPARLTRRGGWNAQPGAAAEKAERQPYLAPPPPPPPPPVLDEARRTAGDLVSLFRSLQPADRVAAIGALSMLLTLVLPWRWTRWEDDIIGLVAAWPLAVLGVAVLALVYWRAGSAHAHFSLRLRRAQAGAALLAALAAGFFLPYATDQKAVRAGGLVVTLSQSKPQVGAILGLVCAVAMLLGSFLAAFSDRER